MKKLFFVLLLTALPVSGHAEEPAVGSSSAPIKLTPVGNRAFQVGERLEFVIKYEFLGAGTATLEVKEGATYYGRPTLRMESHATSNSFIDVFFKVRDYNAATVDRESLMSVGFHQNLREGHYKVMRNTEIDYGKGLFKWEKQYKGKTSNRQGPIHEPVSDMLSSFFVARTLPLERGKEYDVRVFSDGTVIPLRVKVHPDLKKVSVPAGKFECLLIQPLITGDSIFKMKEGKMLIWLTNDDRRIPVLIRSKVAVGAFDAELAEIHTLTPPQ